MKIKNFSLLIILLFTLNIFALNEPSYEPSATDKSNEFKEIVDGLKTLSARFKQYNVSNGKKRFESSGRLYISKPNKFRWDITNPNTQILISDGEKFIDYDVDLEQVSIKPIKKLNKETPIYILSGNYENIKKNYNIEINKNNKKLISYKLSPKSASLEKKDKENNISAVKLTYSGKILQSIEIYSNDKLITLITLHKVSLNKNISPKKFKVRIPKNVEILK